MSNLLTPKHIELIELAVPPCELRLSPTYMDRNFQMHVNYEVACYNLCEYISKLHDRIEKDAEVIKLAKESIA